MTDTLHDKFCRLCAEYGLAEIRLATPDEHSEMGIEKLYVADWLKWPYRVHPIAIALDGQVLWCDSIGGGLARYWWSEVDWSDYSSGE